MCRLGARGTGGGGSEEDSAGDTGCFSEETALFFFFFCTFFPALFCPYVVPWARSLVPPWLPPRDFAQDSSTGK